MLTFDGWQREPTRYIQLHGRVGEAPFLTHPPIPGEKEDICGTYCPSYGQLPR